MPLKSLLRAFKSKPQAPSGQRLRVAVLGGGRMGQFHLKHVAQNAGVQLLGIVDTQTRIAEQLSRAYKTEAYGRPLDLVGKIDAAIIATPTPAHFEAGKMLLEAGISCLIEKPFTETLEQADTLIRLAQDRGCIVQVGHIERFNPAVLEASHYIESPKFIEVSRLGPYDPRVAHIGVVMDLMIHDLDIVLFLVGRPVTRVEAFGASVLSSHEDIAKVRLHFEGGCIADLSASRISLKKYRQIRIFQKNAYVSLDYASASLKVYRKKGDVVKSLADISVTAPKIAKRDPLAMEQEHFFHCVREKRQPLVSGQHGRDALQLAQEILKQIKVHV